MKKLFCLIFSLPMIGFADNVATTASLSVLQNQITQFQQQIQNDAQSIQAANQNLAAVSKQLSALKTQVNQYGNANLSQFKWVDVANNEVPENAYVAASNNGTPLYVCQANYSNGSGYYSGGNNNVIDPGVVTPKGCVITYGGQAYLVPQYSVLTSTVQGFWINGDLIKSSNTQGPIIPFAGMVRLNENGKAAMPVGNSNEPTPLYNALALIGGQENSNNIYICRVNINNQYFLGKLANNTCYVATGKYEATWPVYEVLLTRQP